MPRNSEVPQSAGYEADEGKGMERGRKTETITKPKV